MRPQTENNTTNLLFYVSTLCHLTDDSECFSCVLTNGVDVRRQCAQGPAPVLLDGLRRVKLWDVIIRVDCNQDVGYKCLEGEREGGGRGGGKGLLQFARHSPFKEKKNQK